MMGIEVHQHDGDFVDLNDEQEFLRLLWSTNT